MDNPAQDVGLLVTIKVGAHYGGLAASRGARIPDYISGPRRRYTIDRISTHNGVQEALLKECHSWVALDNLNMV